jgi:hypothetical protein
MPTVNDIIRRLFPAGTRLNEAREAPVSATWSTHPFFGPDLFAVAATLVNLSGCYAHPAVTDEAAGRDTILGNRPDPEPNYVSRVADLGRIWADDAKSRSESARLQNQLKFLWAQLTAAGTAEVAQPLADALPTWCAAAVELLAIADRASKGIGFVYGSTQMSKLMVKRHFHWAEQDPANPLKGLTPSDRRRLTSTLCLLVPPEECCVQPKGRTPQVGCTLRSLSHNLALLPPAGEVTTRYIARPNATERGAFNLLLVPFPYSIDDGDISFDVVAEDEGWGRFVTRQSWIPPGDKDASAASFADFVSGLVQEGERKAGGAIHAIVLPEQSLSFAVADAAAKTLAQKHKGLEAFVAGVLVRPGATRTLPGNRVLVRLFEAGAIKGSWDQPKHHRWRVDDHQARAYGFKPERERLLWWEAIDVANREVHVAQLHGGGIFTCLVCEDLARIEPVHSIVRAIGPSIIIALLFDGPQLKARWAAHAMAGLVDDPGSSVLSLTSLAPAHRWWMHRPDRAGAAGGVQVGLWRDDTMADAEELKLPAHHHALLLQLETSYITERTLDRRSDDGNALAVRKKGAVMAIAHPDPPKWLTMPSDVLDDS